MLPAAAPLPACQRSGCASLRRGCRWRSTCWSWMLGARQQRWLLPCPLAFSPAPSPAHPHRAACPAGCTSPAAAVPVHRGLSPPQPGGSPPALPVTALLVQAHAAAFAGLPGGAGGGVLLPVVLSAALRLGQRHEAVAAWALGTLKLFMGSPTLRLPSLRLLHLLLGWWRCLRAAWRRPPPPAVSRAPPSQTRPPVGRRAPAAAAARPGTAAVPPRVAQVPGSSQRRWRWGRRRLGRGSAQP
jgi:hypothetical protein